MKREKMFLPYLLLIRMIGFSLGLLGLFRRVGTAVDIENLRFRVGVVGAAALNTNNGSGGTAVEAGMVELQH